MNIFLSSNTDWAIAVSISGKDTIGYMEGESLSWRTDKQFNLPPAGLTIASPYDVEVRYSNKRGLTWHGYKAHLTETCDDQTPHLIIHVETTPVDILDNQAVSGGKRF